MGEKNWGCVKQTAMGCGCMVAIGVAVLVMMAVMIMQPMNRAVGARTDLEELHGTQEAFVPPAYGAPFPDRIEAFLAVRRALTTTCADFWFAEHAVAALEAFDDSEDVSRVAVMKQAMATTKTMMGMGSLIGHFFETRNQALVEAEMGLGEYTYIYVLAYGGEIVNPTDKLQLFGPTVINGRVRRALQSMLQNQLEQLQQEGGSEEAVAVLTWEVEALENDSHRIPWQDGLPAAIADALLPYREELSTLFCGSTPPFELMINEKRGLGIETR